MFHEKRRLSIEVFSVLSLSIMMPSTDSLPIGRVHRRYDRQPLR